MADDEFMKVDVEGLKQFQRDLKKFSPALAKELKARFRVTVAAVVATAKQKAPKRSGRLARGVRPSITQSQIAVVSKEEGYTRITEFGGRHPVFGKKDTWVYQPARPFIFPAVRQHSEDTVRDAIEALKTAEKETGFN